MGDQHRACGNKDIAGKHDKRKLLMSLKIGFYKQL